MESWINTKCVLLRPTALCTNQLVLVRTSMTETVISYVCCTVMSDTQRCIFFFFFFSLSNTLGDIAFKFQEHPSAHLSSSSLMFHGSVSTLVLSSLYLIFPSVWVCCCFKGSFIPLRSTVAADVQVCTETFAQPSYCDYCQIHLLSHLGCLIYLF